MTQDEYQKRAVALESKRDDSAGVDIPVESLAGVAGFAAFLDLTKRHAFYDKKPDSAREKSTEDRTDGIVDVLIPFAGKRFGDTGINPRILHGILGLATEVGEVVEILIAEMATGNPAHAADLQEELGDLEWYMALLRDEIGVTQEQIQRQNLAKLEARYGRGQQFGGERDIAAEQEAMKGAA